MTPEELAALSTRAYRHMTPWSAGSFAQTLARPQALLVTTDHAFALGLVVADEAEILALATDPAHQHRGEGATLLTRFHGAARVRGAATVFLEVAAANAPAIGFYTAQGYAATGRRKAYYRRPDGTRDDAVIMSRRLP